MGPGDGRFFCVSASPSLSVALQAEGRVSIVSCMASALNEILLRHGLEPSVAVITR